MVDVMGGEMGVDSEPGQGSDFWVRLPAAKPAATPVA
jgi:signal transduction histidine kinase